MMHKFKTPLIIVITLAATVLFVRSSTFQNWTGSRFGRTSKPGEAPNSQSAKDRAIVLDKVKNEGEYAGAMLRLASVLDEDGMDAAFDQAKAKSPYLRASAASALGYSDTPKAKSALQKLLNDEVESVRLEAIGGVAHRPGEDREKILTEVLARKSSSPREVMMANAGMVGITGRIEVKTQAVGALLQVLKDSQDQDLRRETLYRVMAVDPLNPMLIELLKKEAMNGTSPVVDPALRHLIGFDKKWVMERFSTFWSHPNDAIRIAMIQTVPSTCPANRVELLEGVIKNEKKREIAATAESIQRMLPTICKTEIHPVAPAAEKAAEKAGKKR